MLWISVAIILSPRHAFPNKTCRSHVRLFASLGWAPPWSNPAYLEHRSPSSASDDGSESRRHETAPGQNARMKTTTTAAISSQHSKAPVPPLQTNNLNSKDPD
jgi:hypothetical protein